MFVGRAGRVGPYAVTLSAESGNRLPLYYLHSNRREKPGQNFGNFRERGERETRSKLQSPWSKVQRGQRTGVRSGFSQSWRRLIRLAGEEGGIGGEGAFCCAYAPYWTHRALGARPLEDLRDVPPHPGRATRIRPPMVLADGFAADSLGEAGVVFVLEDGIADAGTAADLGEWERGVDKLQLVGQLIGIPGQ